MPVVVERGKEATSRYGHYKHDDMIDTPYGSKAGFSCAIPKSKTLERADLPFFAFAPLGHVKAGKGLCISAETYSRAMVRLWTSIRGKRQ